MENTQGRWAGEASWQNTEKVNKISCLKIQTSSSVYVHKSPSDPSNPQGPDPRQAKKQKVASQWKSGEAYNLLEAHKPLGLDSANGLSYPTVQVRNLEPSLTLPSPITPIQ